MTNLPNNLRYELTYKPHSILNKEWRYYAEGSKGAVEFWVRENPLKDSYEDYYGGFEVHSATPTDDRCPDHGQCRALSNRPCWHDGSSLYASEFWIPLWKSDKNNHDGIFELLSGEYTKRFV